MDSKLSGYSQQLLKRAAHDGKVSSADAELAFRFLMYLIVYKERKEGLERLICRIYKKIVD
ncbi:hypothetical protein KQI74_26245 [Paenibacillus barcinonensis]|uniref:hypothetical protein n=1 Tax=Paenibacillus barcinonensis TaxID=198119 RepID=UPI001C10FA59|nr:hypothetical protein [Paenibacillus barcinonensis]MBU5355759.1 hypothetical protein [Paenibacillus barcinonensis]